MPGVGLRNNLVGNRLTPRVTVREVDAVDASSAAVDEIIDTRLNEGETMVTRGDHATLALFVILIGGATAATLQLFARGDDEAEDEGSSSSSPGDDPWCLAGALSVTADNLLQVFVDMPAGEYKVVVTGITGGVGTRVIIREQHSA